MKIVLTFTMTLAGVVGFVLTGEFVFALMPLLGAIFAALGGR